MYLIKTPSTYEQRIKFQAEPEPGAKFRAATPPAEGSNTAWFLEREKI